MTAVRAIRLAAAADVARGAAASAPVPAAAMMRTAAVPAAVTVGGAQAGTVAPVLEPHQVGFRQLLHLLLVQVVTLGHVQGHHLGTQLQPLFRIVAALVSCAITLPAPTNRAARRHRVVNFIVFIR